MAGAMCVSPLLFCMDNCRIADGDTNLQMANVARMTEIDEKIIERFKRTASAGLNLTKANDYQSCSAGLDMTYTTKRYISNFYVSNLNGNYRLNRRSRNRQDLGA
jgi:hypothetical protein